MRLVWLRERLRDKKCRNKERVVRVLDDTDFSFRIRASDRDRTLPYGLDELRIHGKVAIIPLLHLARAIYLGDPRVRGKQQLQRSARQGTGKW